LHCAVYRAGGLGTFEQKVRGHGLLAPRELVVGVLYKGGSRWRLGRRLQIWCTSAVSTPSGSVPARCSLFVCIFVALCIVAACPAARRCSGRAPLPLSMYWWGWQGHAYRVRAHASRVPVVRQQLRYCGEAAFFWHPIHFGYGLIGSGNYCSTIGLIGCPGSGIGGAGTHSLQLAYV